MFRNVVNIKCHVLENSMKFDFNGRNLRKRRLTLQSTINGSCIGSTYFTSHVVKILLGSKVKSYPMHICSTKQILSLVQVQVHNQHRTSTGRNVFWEGPKFFKLCPTLFSMRGQTPCDALSYGPDLQVSSFTFDLVFSTWVFPNPKPVFLVIFCDPKPVFFQIPYQGI